MLTEEPNKYYKEALTFFKDFDVHIIEGDFFVEFLIKGCHKAYGMEILCKELNIGLVFINYMALC